MGKKKRKKAVKPANGRIEGVLDSRPIKCAPDEEKPQISQNTSFNGVSDAVPDTVIDALKGRGLRSWDEVLDALSDYALLAEENREMLKKFTYPLMATRHKGKYYCPLCGWRLDGGCRNYCGNCGKKVFKE